MISMYTEEERTRFVEEWLEEKRTINQRAYVAKIGVPYNTFRGWLGAYNFSKKTSKTGDFKREVYFSSKINKALQSWADKKGCSFDEAVEFAAAKLLKLI